MTAIHDGLPTMTAHEFRRWGYLQECNRRLLNPLGLVLVVGRGNSLEVRDARDFIAGPVLGAIDTEAAERMAVQWRCRTADRRLIRGYVVEGETPWWRRLLAWWGAR